MKNIILLLIIFTTFSVESQVKEFGFFSGTSYYIGDINRNHFSQQDLSLGLVYKTDFPNDRISLRFHLMYNKLKANDNKSEVEEQLVRNLGFKNSVIEFGPIIEIDFFKFHPGQNNKKESYFGSPYFFGGINFMRMNPKANIDGVWTELQPLGTEGQGTILRNKNNEIVKKYSRNQIIIPFGFGVKMNISHHLCLSVEYGMRKTYTDYIDDVSGLYPDLIELGNQAGELSAQLSNRSESFEGINNSAYGLQRGNSSDKDWYAVTGIILTYEFFKDVICPKW